MARMVRTIANKGVVGLAIKNRDRRTRKDYKKKLGPRLRPKASALSLEQCSANLLKATLDPFGMVNDVCIPFGNSRPSQKIRSLTRGTGSIGVNGAAFVAVAPTFVTDSAVAFMSTSAWAGGPIDCNDPNVTTINNPTGYATSYFDASGTINQGRVCSVGLRVRYTGTELNKSGQIYLLSTPDRVSMEGMNVTTIGEFAETQISNFDRGWHTISTVAQEDTEWDYSPASGVTTTATIYPMSAGVVSTLPGAGAPIMAVYITGVKDMTFAFELVVYSEVIGKNVQGLTTRNATDLEGLGKVVQIASRVPALLAQGMLRAAAIALAIKEVSSMSSMLVDVGRMAIGGGNRNSRIF